MAALEPLYKLLSFNTIINKNDAFLFEAEIFIRIYSELTTVFKEYCRDYFSIMNFNFDMKQAMIDDNFIKFIINDLIISETYSIEGIAYHTQSPEDVIAEIASGCNTNPSLKLSRKIIELHRLIRADLYQEIIKKFLMEHIALIDKDNKSAINHLKE